jgi:hypothetical protein
MPWRQGRPRSYVDEVVVVYDDSEGHITPCTPRARRWPPRGSTPPGAPPGPLRIGRGHTADGGWGEYFHGGADTVRVFGGALTAAQAKSFACPY